ncbi:MAG: hypothetical protein ACRDHO_11590 [Actinomycetota bacterium]
MLGESQLVLHPLLMLGLALVTLGILFVGVQWFFWSAWWNGRVPEGVRWPGRTALGFVLLGAVSALLGAMNYETAYFAVVFTLFLVTGLLLAGLVFRSLAAQALRVVPIPRKGALVGLVVMAGLGLSAFYVPSDVAAPDLSGEEMAFARSVLDHYLSLGEPLDHLVTQGVRVLEVKPIPGEPCSEGPEVSSSRAYEAKVRVYSFFRVPYRDWTVTCRQGL